MNTTNGRIVIVGGICASGKNTVGEKLAERLGWQFVDADAYHLDAAKKQVQEEGLALWGEWDDDNAAKRYRTAWIERIADDARAWLKHNLSVVLACSAHQSWIRKKVISWNSSAVSLAYLSVRKGVLTKRISARKGHYYPPEGLENQWRTQELPKPSLEPNVIVVDANSNGYSSKVTEIIRRLGLELPGFTRTHSQRKEIPQRVAS